MFQSEKILSEWSKADVACWLEKQRLLNDWDFDVEPMVLPGSAFAALTEEQMKELANNRKAGIIVYNAKELQKELQVHKQKFPEFQFSNFEVTEHNIPGRSQAVPILYFDKSAGIDPPFMIDHYDIRGKLERWVKHATKEDGQHKSFCVVNGLVKTGKTSVLKYMLPPLVRQHEPDAVFCHLDFENFMTPDSNRYEIANNLLHELEGWARANGFPVPKRTGDTYADVREDLHGIMNMFRASGHKIYFLFDEVQRFFQVHGNPDHVLFKSLLQVGKWNGSIRFAFTGSGMVRAWIEMAKCPANGTTVGGSSWSVNLPPADPPEVLDHTTELLLRHYNVDASSDLDKLLSTMPSVAGKSYLIKHWIQTPPESQTFEKVGNRVSLKFEQEFQADMLPLRQSIHSLDKTSNLIKLRQLAEGGATEDGYTLQNSSLVVVTGNVFKKLVNRNPTASW